MKGLQSFDPSNFKDDKFVWYSNLEHTHLAESISNLQVLQLVTLQSLEPQKLTLPLWKDLEPVVKIIPT